MIKDVCLHEGIPNINIPGALFKNGVPNNNWVNDKTLSSIIKDGYIYHSFRRFPKGLLEANVGLRERKMVLLVRDPRDALVSAYYSYGGKHISHRLPDKNQEEFIKQINTTSNLDVNEYAIEKCRPLVNKLNEYIKFLNFDNVFIIKYENIYYDKLSSLKAIFNHFDIGVSATTLQNVSLKHDIRPEKEDITKHIRKGTPGDHKDKLSKETIDHLNNIFRETGSFFGYEM